jgi:hypothetical protein
MCRVVHVNKERYDVYIGRGNCPKTGVPSKYYNPFTHIAHKPTLAEFTVSSREEALASFKEYLFKNEALMDSVMELDGKVLGCWCIEDASSPPIPYICHGQIILEVIEQIKAKKFFAKRK